MIPAPDLPKFPKGFIFGASSAAYQIEGNNTGSDLWRWERRRPWTPSGRAANSWELWEEDIRCAAALGLGAYRFSVEWARVVPRRGEVDEAALGHYRRVVAALEAARIRPMVCLHHFTNPQWLLDAYPRLWGDERTVERFVEFAAIVAGALPSVREWLPFNEPVGYAALAHLFGLFPPGERLLLHHARDFLGGPVRHLALAHRRTHALLKARDPGCRVGVAHNINVLAPLKVPRDEPATRLWDEVLHYGFLDALVLGRFDADLDGEREAFLGDGPTLDWIGVNYYTRVFVMRVPGLLRPASGIPVHPDASMIPGLGAVYRWLTAGRATLPRDDMEREIYPDGLRQVVEAVHRRYALPILVTENGVPDAEGTLRGPHLAGHLAALRAAMDTGVPVLGYLYWSLLDNWEWGSFRPRFGLYKVHYENGFRRELTEGGRLYAEIIVAQPRG